MKLQLKMSLILQFLVNKKTNFGLKKNLEVFVTLTKSNQFYRKITKIFIRKKNQKNGFNFPSHPKIRGKNLPICL